MFSRRSLFALLAASLVLLGCASAPYSDEQPPIVFVHGNGDSAALWQTTLWRFESQGWPPERLHAITLPYPLARDDDTVAQPGRSSTAEHMAYLKAEVDQVLQATGARKLVLMGNSRGGYAIRNYIQNGGGQGRISHAILGGVPNHGVWAIRGYREGNEFSGTGPFLRALNRPKNAAGDEVTGPVRWLTIRSDNNDKFAQPNGLWIGAPDTATGVSFAGPALRGATNVVIAGIDHRETSFSPAAFSAAYRFITGRGVRPVIQAEAAPQLKGTITGLGLNPLDPASGDYANNLPLAGAQLAVYATDVNTGARLGAAAYRTSTGSDGVWGPFQAQAGVQYEFVIRAPGYTTTHIYRSRFPRSSDIVHLRADRLTDAGQSAKSSVTLIRPRGYFDASRDSMTFDGNHTLPGVPAKGGGVSSTALYLAEGQLRPISAEFNGEKITGQTWPVADNHLVILELTN